MVEERQNLVRRAAHVATGDRGPLVHSRVGLLQPIYKRFPLGSDLCGKRCSDSFVEPEELVDRH